MLETLSATDAVNAAALPERAGIGKRRAEVILYLLREMKVVRRLRGGYVLRHAEPITDAHVETLLREYVERASADRSRLDEMMLYAETVRCRMQVIRRYFDEPEGELCGNCDNCVNRAWEMHEPEVALHGASEDEGVTRIETLNGPILTTAPETLPQTIHAKFQEGVVVRHKRFGRGRVRDVVGDTVMVQFEDGGCKRLKDSFLKNA